MAGSVLNNLNVNQLKIFESVYRLKSMTLAAQELFLTQSGVSQHIQSFEESLGIVLFIRSRSGLFATPEADRLYESCKSAYDSLKQALIKIKNPGPQQLEGLVKIGVPTEFGNNVVIPKLSEWSKKNRLVKFDLIYGHKHQLLQMLQKGELDIAFVDSLEKDRKILSKPVYRENLTLVASTQYMKDKKGKESLAFLQSLDFLEYEHQESILRMWFQHHYSKKNAGLSIRAWAMNVQGVASLIQNHMGAGVIPDHLLSVLKEKGVELYLFKGRKVGLKNEISLAWLKARPLRPEAESIKNYFIE